MAKPDSVQSKAAAADEMIRQLAAQRDGTDTTNVVDISKIVKPVVAPPVLEFEEYEEEEEYPTPSIEQQVAALQADITRLSRDRASQDQVLQAQAAQLDAYRQMIANMNAAPAPTQEQPKSPIAYTQEHIDVFGQDMVDFVTDVARNIYRAEVQGLAASMQGLQQEVANTSSRAAVSAFDVFERKLDTLAPGWRALDEDPVFLEWLKARPVFGNAIAAASQSLDHDAAAEIFNTYTSLTAGTQTGAASKKSVRQTELEGQIAPGRARQLPSTTKQQQQAKQWTQSEIRGIYRDRLSKKGRHATYTDAEFAAIEADIARAQREGRVAWDQ